MPRRKGSANNQRGGNQGGQAKGNNNAASSHLTPASPSNRRSQSGKKTVGTRPMASSPSRPTVPETNNSKGIGTKRRYRSRTPTPSATPPSPSQPPKSPPSTIPEMKTPMMEPVEQRWEENEGKYLHKKFKKMATMTTEREVASEADAVPVSQEPPNLASLPVPNFPLKHSALSLLSSSARPSSPLSLQSNSLAVTQPPGSSASVTTILAGPPVIANAHSDDQDRRRRNTCPFCQLVCAKPSVLDKHIRTHTNERPFPCQPCGFAFKTRSNLYKHCKSRTHALKVEEGIDSSSTEIMAELGESEREEIDSPEATQNGLPSLPAPPPGLLHNPLTLAYHSGVPVSISHKSLQEATTSQLLSQNSVLYRQADIRPSFNLSGSVSIRPANGVLELPQQPVVISNRDEGLRENDTRLPNAPISMMRTSSSTSSAPQMTLAQTVPTDLSAKKPAANDIVRQIDKVISHNQAIVETNDPLWARRYHRHNSKDGPGNDKAPARGGGRKYSLTTSSIQPNTNTLTLTQPSNMGGKPVTITQQRVAYQPSTMSQGTSASTLVHPQYRSSNLLMANQGASLSSMSSNSSSQMDLVVPSSSASPSVMLVRQDPSGDHAIPLNLSENRKRPLSGTPVSIPGTQSTPSKPDDMLKAQSVREVWIQSCKKPVKSGNMMQLEGLASSLQAGIPAHPENPEGSVIKELLLQSRINGLISSQQSPMQPGSLNLSTASKDSKPQVTLITELKHPITTTSVPNSSNEWSKSTQIIYTNSIPSSSTSAGNRRQSEIVVCSMCSLAFKATDIAVHQLYHCPKRNTQPQPLQQQQQQQQQQQVLPNISPSKRQRLDKMPSKMYGGHMVETPIPNSPAMPNGLLQIAQRGLQSGGGVISVNSSPSRTPDTITITPQKLSLVIDTNNLPSATSSFSIPGVPTPSFAGVLTSMKSAPLFSLPGKRTLNQVELTKTFSSLSSASVMSSFSLVSSSSSPVPGLSTSISNPGASSSGANPVPFVLGIPGPYSQPSLSPATPSSSLVTISPTSTSSSGLNLSSSYAMSNSKTIPQIIVSAAKSTSLQISSDDAKMESVVKTEDEKFLRPSSLSLVPGSFKPKKHVMLSAGATLVSPETPRPRKSYVLTYQNGTAYTHLGMKCSTRVYFCSMSRPQPMYVPHKPRLSMYSNWKVVSQDSHPSGLSAKESLQSYNSGYRKSRFGLVSIARSNGGETTSGLVAIDNAAKVGSGKTSDCMIMVHSSQWKVNRTPDQNPKEEGQKSEDQTAESSKDLGKNSSADGNRTRDDQDDEGSNNEITKKPLEGGYKTSDDDYTYVRGRGRGRYVCNSCGIRCKKPSMLKKHIRTHTNFRPYTCKHCNFAFKTKGNLTKHMKSKAHHKKCVELGISPTAEDSTGSDTQSERGDIRMTPGDSDSDDEDEDDDEEDQFEDADEDSSSTNEPMDSNEKEAAQSLLSLGRSQAPWVSNHLGLTGSRPKPSTYPYSSSPTKPVVTTPSSVSPLGQVSENVQVTQNTMKAGEMQKDEQSGTNPLLSTPPVTMDRYYFQSASKESVVASSSCSIWSLAKLTNQTTTSHSSLTSAHRIVVPVGNGLVPLVSVPSPQIRERAADILSPVTESATILSYLDKTVTLAGKTADPNLSEVGTSVSSSLPTAQLQTYLQEKATLRAKLQQNEIKIRKEDSPVTETKSAGMDLPAPNVMAPNASVGGDQRSPDKQAATKPPSMSIASGSMEEGSFAPRNVTMNVKDLPSKITRGLTPLHSNQPNVNPKEINTITQMKAVANANYNQRNEANQAAAALQAKHAVASAEKAKSEGHAVTSSSSSNVPAPQTSSGAVLHSNQDIMQTNADGKSVCGICKKVFAKASQLRLHVNIHYMERPFRCEDCSVSFRTKGHLVKHERSAGHFNKVNINQTFGAPSTSNPRPFKCVDCLVKFRIHGHLAKHLRSKMHIMKLECSGKLPIGIFAEMERLGTNLNEIDTTDCKSALTSLQQMAEHLYKDDPSKLVHLLAGGGGSQSESADEGNSEAEACQPEIKVEPMDTVGPNEVPGTLSMPRDQLYGSAAPTDLTIENLKIENRRSSFSSSQEERSTDSENESHTLTGVRCPHCPKSFNDNIAMQVHLFVNHQNTRDSPAASPSVNHTSIRNGERTVIASRASNTHPDAPQASPSSSSMSPRAISSREGSVGSSNTAEEDTFPCGLCNAVLSNRNVYKQHLLSHAAPRPFVCHHCDAGFTTSHQLEAHMKLH